MSRRTLSLIGAGLLTGALGWVPPAAAQQKTEITFARFFGACDGDYGTSQDVAHARGECGVMTTLTNLFNAANKDNIVVKPQIIEWGPYYQQFNARMAAHDVPTIAVMHSSQLGDYTRYVEPLDDALKEAGIDSSDFTPNARNAVTIGGKIYAMPWDTHSWLWHFNIGLFKKAGLVDAEGQPIVPKTVDEMVAQAKQVKEKTGKPYIIIATSGSGDFANAARGYYSWLYDQNGTIFPNGDEKVDFKTPGSMAALTAFEALIKADVITKGLDGSGGLGGFLNGNGAVYMTGTWRIDDFLAAAAKPDSPLHEGYTTRVYPNLFKTQSVWTDNHTWVLPKGSTAAQHKAALVFLKFLWDHNFDWARGGGHLPARQSLMAEYAKLPLRQYVVDIPTFGRALPHDVHRQFGFQNMIGEEIANMINAGKTADQAADAMQERSVSLLRGR
ncbi:MAG TPA: extracellular solute-binding protein [Acetobacteraceae bacterium]|jgi:multiple sugar transport system substrate-binding protein|nr:extracellular solute-binding protein [Acetobacteraceae bacterium]